MGCHLFWLVTTVGKSINVRAVSGGCAIKNEVVSKLINEATLLRIVSSNTNTNTTITSLADFANYVQCGGKCGDIVA